MLLLRGRFHRLCRGRERRLHANPLDAITCMTDTTTIVPEIEPQDKRIDTLWVTDAELIRRMGVPEKIARQWLRQTDAQRTGFPQKQALFGGRRYWPAVRAYLDRTYGLNIPASPQRTSHAR